MWISLLLSSAFANLILFDTTYLSPIEISSIHLGETATYTFNLKTTVTLPKFYVFNIEFPSQYETITATGAAVTKSTTYTTATLSTSTLVASFQLPLEILENETFRVQLSGVANPVAFRLVGPFNVYVRQRNDIMNFAENKLYTTIAFISAIPAAITAAVDINYTGFVATVDTLTSYAFRIALTDDVDMYTWFEVTLPTGWSKADGIDSNCKLEKVGANDSAIPGTFTCSTTSNKITVKGLSGNIHRQNHDQFYIYIVVTSILNPSYEMALSASNFIVRVIDQETVRVLQNHSAPSPQITKGTVTAISVTQVNSFVKILANTVKAVFDVKCTPAH